MSVMEFKIICHTPIGEFSLTDLDEGSTIFELKQSLQHTANISMRLFRSLKNKQSEIVPIDNDHAKLSELNIISGDALEVTFKAKFVMDMILASSASENEAPKKGLELTPLSNPATAKHVDNENLAEPNSMELKSVEVTGEDGKSAPELNSAVSKPVEAKSGNLDDDLRVDNENLAEPNSMELKSVEVTGEDSKSAPELNSAVSKPVEAKSGNLDGDLPLKKMKLTVDNAIECSSNSACGSVPAEPEIVNKGAGPFVPDSNVQSLVCDNSVIERYSVPADNSCLFWSMNHILSHGFDTYNFNSYSLRVLIGREIRANPERFNAIILGKPPDKYASWINDMRSWGGGIELEIFSEYFKIEILALDIHRKGQFNFGDNHNYSQKCYLVYNGTHYDPLILKNDHTVRTVFFPEEEIVFNKVMDFVHKERCNADKLYNANVNLVQCDTCLSRFSGEADATAHAVKTRHINFSQYVPH